VEAGALLCLEAERLMMGEPGTAEGILVQMSRPSPRPASREKDHAGWGRGGRGNPPGFFLLPEEERMIVGRSPNHEAFLEPQPIEFPLGQLISDALYDDRKFTLGAGKLYT